MLFEKETLAEFNKLQSKYPKFNVQIFLNLLQITTRPLGYPPYKLAINNGYYLNLFHREIDNAVSTQNSRKLHLLMQSLYQTMICFSYIQSTIPINEIDEELLALLFRAIDQRMNTTEEERCAEKCLLTMLVQLPQETLELIARNHQQLVYVNIHPLLQEQISRHGVKQTTRLAENLHMSTPLTETVSSLEDHVNVLQNANKSLEELPSFMNGFTKRGCQLIIGSYLFNIVAEPSHESWINNCPFLKASMTLAIQENGKKELSQYITLRQRENDFFSFFRKYPKAVKLSSADKFFKALDNKSVIYTSEERSALQEDRGSRLTSIYLRYAR
jgi:hypothetical protein